MNVIAAQLVASEGDDRIFLQFVETSGAVHSHEYSQTVNTTFSRLIVQLPKSGGLIVFADDGQAWPFSYEMAQRIVTAFAPRHMAAMPIEELPKRDQASLFEAAVERALEAEPSMPALFAAAKFARRQ